MSETTKFPYWAFDRASKTIVQVVAYKSASLATLEDGTVALRNDLTIPSWLEDAVQEMEDWQDEVDTQRAAQDKPLWERPEAHGSGRSKLFKSQTPSEYTPMPD